MNWDSPVLFYRWINTPSVQIHWWIKTCIRKLRLPQKRKTKFNNIVLVMQGFYFFVKFGLVLIYILKVYRKKPSSILLRKNMFNSLLAFCSWKACTFSSFDRFLCWKFRNYLFLSLFFFFFYRYFPGQIMTIHKMGREGELFFLFSTSNR